MFWWAIPRGNSVGRKWQLGKTVQAIWALAVEPFGGRCAPLKEGAFKGCGGSPGGVRAAVTGLQDREERLAPRLTEDAAWGRVRDTGHKKPTTMPQAGNHLRVFFKILTQ